MALKSLTIVHLYPKEMNIYGDTGNIKTLAWRLKARGLGYDLIAVGIGDQLPKQVDIMVAGGGQDSGQELIQTDLMKRSKQLKRLADDGLVILVVCGMYQLLGHYFKTAEGSKIEGVGIFDAVTKAGPSRLIGNIVIQSPFGRLVGFENHSGQTILAGDQLPLGRVIKGSGNDGSSGREGAVYKNAFGTYLHGPILPKNPVLADELIKRALERRYGKDSVLLPPLDDGLAIQAADLAAKRP